jgi:hypothetical protein
LLDATFAYGLLQNSFDLNGKIVTISFAAGTYPQMTFTGLLPGVAATRTSNNVLLQGDPLTPSKVNLPIASIDFFISVVGTKPFSLS